MLAMMILLVIDIFTRTIDKPIQGMTELSVFVMMVVIYLGLARCEEHKEHVQLEIIVNALPPSIRRFMGLFTHFLAIMTVSILLYALTRNAITSFQSGEALSGTVELRIWPVKFIMLIGLVFFWLQTLVNTVDTAKQLRNVNK